jgi:ankyrin repeat protein
MKIGLLGRVGGTSLMVAASLGHLEMAKFLVTHGADIHLRVKNISALKIALERRHPEGADYLSNLGARE